MAEIAAFVAAEEAISTTVQVGAVAGYALAKATLPLKASLSRFATTSQGGSSSLSRSGHTLSVVDHNAYIIGGEIADGTLAGDEVQIIRLPSKRRTEVILEGQVWEYKAVPAISVDEGGAVPVPRTEHTACVVGKSIYVFGGRGNNQKPLRENGRVWIFDTQTLMWSFLDPPSGLGGVFPTVYLHAAEIHTTTTANSIIVLGGLLPDGSLSPGVWAFDITSSTWRTLQTEGLPSSINQKTMPLPPNMSIAHDRLFTITGSSELHSSLHCLDLSQAPDHLKWDSIDFPSNALTPGPRPRHGGGLTHIALGQGREYLLYFFGTKTPTTTGSSSKDGLKSNDREPPSQWSDIWAYQLPSQASTSAQLKDKIRAALPGGIESREGEWAEVEIEAADQTAGSGNDGIAGVVDKAHPGPRASFAACSVSTATGGYGVKTGDKADSVVIWGGIDPRGERQGDGWEIKLTL